MISNEESVVAPAPVSASEPETKLTLEKAHELIQTHLKRVKIGGEGHVSLLLSENLNDQQIIVILQALAEREYGITRLSFPGTHLVAYHPGVPQRYYQISQKVVEAIGAWLASNNTVKLLYLSHCHIGPEGAKAIAAGLKVNKTLRELELRFNNMGDVGAKAIADSLKDNKTVEKLDLTANAIGETGATAIIENLQFNTKVIVDLRNNPIEDASKLVYETAIIIEGSKIPRVVMRVMIDKLFLVQDERGWMLILQDYLRTTKNIYGIDVVSLTLNDFVGDKIMLLFNVLEKNDYGIHVLDLSNSRLDPNRRIGLEAAKVIGEWLKKNGSIQNLHLRNVGLDDEGMKVIAKAITVNRSLQHLDLSDNPNTDEGSSAILQAVTRIKELGNHCNLSSVLLGNKAMDKTIHNTLADSCTLAKQKSHHLYFSHLNAIEPFPLPDVLLHIVAEYLEGADAFLANVAVAGIQSDKETAADNATTSSLLYSFNRRPAANLSLEPGPMSVSASEQEVEPEPAPELGQEAEPGPEPDSNEESQVGANVSVVSSHSSQPTVIGRDSESESFGLRKIFCCCC